jgi:hypothetical protein
MTTYPSFEKYWAKHQYERGVKLSEKFASIKEAFNGFQNKEDIQLLAKIIHPEQTVVCFEKSGSAQVADTDGLPKWAEREPYGTVRNGTVYYFHPSTLKEGDSVEWDNKIWKVLFNYFVRGTAESLAYQCIYLLEIANVFAPQE